jgi:hypothetical protein
MYVEILNFDDDSDGTVHSISDGSSVNFFLSQGNVQSLRIYIGNIPPFVEDNALSANGGDRSVQLNWDSSAEWWPATSYKIYREGADDVVPLTGLSFLDNEVFEGHDSQGLLYESTWAYTLTAFNAAGESTDGFSVRTSGGSQENIEGTQSDASATTDDNLDPVASLAHTGCFDLSTQTDCEGGNGTYNPVHDGSPEENGTQIGFSGESSSDSDEFDDIDRYTWSIDGNVYEVESYDTPWFTFMSGNVHEADVKSFTASLYVESDYPIRGGIGTRSSSNTIVASLSEEPNIDPDAAGGLELIVAGDGSSDSTMDDYNNSDSNDYDSGAQKWYVPHDGDPETSTASLSFDASASSDDDDDDLSYQFKLIAGEIEGFSFDDLNENGVYDLGEPFELEGGDEIYVTELDVSSEVTYSDNLPADVYVVKMIVTDSYGDSDESSIVVGVEGERNEGPSVYVGANQQWYMGNGSNQKNITVDDNYGTDADSDPLTFIWKIRTSNTPYKC